ncbi:MAG: hypothetical protein LAO55_18790 [Acidobacteriia bacterium]|nr:hypothetical protein [Terriglobia bacterium]
MIFDLHIGIDYSGRETPASRTSALQVYAASNGGEPQQVRTPACPPAGNWNWSRKEIANWLIERANAKARFIAGLDHGFSFPASYFLRHGLKSWPSFLDDFSQYWKTDDDHTYVDFIRDQKPSRTGFPNELRLTEKWTSSAKSVFQFDIQGQVAKSTHAGIPWLRRIKQAVGGRVHFWPFDGWSVPEGKSVIAEVYPSLFTRRYPGASRTADQQAAYAVARWLSECDAQGFLPRYFDPPLTAEERKTADLEGWILAVC